jgi:hypothetical protein
MPAHGNLSPRIANTINRARSMRTRVRAQSMSCFSVRFDMAQDSYSHLFRGHRVKGQASNAAVLSSCPVELLNATQLNCDRS